MRLYIIRHADPDYENNTITPTGPFEAQALARRTVNVGLSRIYTSPMGRAQHTAQYTADATKLEPVVLPWTAELSIDGVVGIDGTKWAAWNLEGQVFGAVSQCRITVIGMSKMNSRTMITANATSS